jgi:hypothetical protein
MEKDKMNAIKADVINTVKSHNEAWAVLEDLDTQSEYVHENIIFISPPYKNAIIGKKQYLENYSEWMEHATVKSASDSEMNVILFNDGNCAIVWSRGEMIYDYDDSKGIHWKGMDMMSLVYENGKWLITSDMFVSEREDDE